MDLMGAYQELVEKLTGWIEGFIVMLPNLFIAVLVLILFWLGARFLSRLVLKLLNRITTTPQIARLLSTVVYIAILLVGVFISLGILQLEKTVTSLLAGVGIVGLALGFAFQDLASNFMAGIFISVRRPFSLGDLIESNDYFGRVEEVTLRSTKIRVPQGQIVLIPNKDVFENPIVNYTVTGVRRIDLGVGVSYGDDLEKAMRVAIEAVESVESRDKDREVELFYKEFGGSSINFDIRFWIDFAKQTDFLRAQHEAIIKIHQAFDQHDITIPFPIRTLDFGIVGGATLAEMIESSPLASLGDGSNGDEQSKLSSGGGEGR